MKWLSVGVCCLVASFAPGQSAIGLRAGLTDISFFTPDDEDLYYADYSVAASPGIGMSWCLKGADGNLISCALVRDELDFQYDARQFITNASFANSSKHELIRYMVKGTRLWEVASLGRFSLFLGPGLGLTATQVRESQGHGFNIQQLEWTDSAGNVFTYPGPVYWAYKGRKPEAFHAIYVSASIALELQAALSPQWGLDFGTSAELLLTPWLNEEGVRFTSNKTFEGHVGVHYWLLSSKRDP